MGVCGSRSTADNAGDGSRRRLPAALPAQDGQEHARQRRAQRDDDEAMDQAIALSLAMAAAGRDAAPAGHEARPTTSGALETQFEADLLLHVYWDPAWDASESALRPGGAMYWSSEANSALGPSEWISAHQDPVNDTIATRQVRARILRNHPALLDPAGPPFPFAARGKRTNVLTTCPGL